MLDIIKDLHLTVQNIVAGIAFISQNSSDNDLLKWEIKNGANEPTVTISYNLSYEEFDKRFHKLSEAGQSLHARDKITVLPFLSNSCREKTIGDPYTGSNEDKYYSSSTNNVNSPLVKNIPEYSQIYEPQIQIKIEDDIPDVLQSLTNPDRMSETKEIDAELEKDKEYANCSGKSRNKSKDNSEDDLSEHSPFMCKVVENAPRSSEFLGTDFAVGEEAAQDYKRFYFERNMTNMSESGKEGEITSRSCKSVKSNCEMHNNDSEVSLQEMSSENMQNLPIDSENLLIKIKKEKEDCLDESGNFLSNSIDRNIASEQTGKIAADVLKEEMDKVIKIGLREKSTTNWAKLKHESSRQSNVNEQNLSASPYYNNFSHVYRVEKLYACQYCEKTFSEKNRLVGHERSHTGEKPYSCTFCGKGFRTLRDQQKHERIHTGEKPYVCRFCNKAFTRDHHKTRHERIHTGEKPFSCSYCGKCFSQAYSKKEHERIHTNKSFVTITQSAET